MAPQEQRKHFLIPEAATHGRRGRGRRPPPTAAQLGTQAWERDAFPDSMARASLLSARRPCRLKGVQCRGGSAQGLASIQSLQEALGSQPSPLHGWERPRSLCDKARTGALAAGLQERTVRSDALSTCLGYQFTYLQSGGMPRRGKARASALTTTAVTGWPGM